MDIEERIYVEFSPGLKSRLNHAIALREVLAAAGIEASVAIGGDDPKAVPEPAKASADR